MSEPVSLAGTNPEVFKRERGKTSPDLVSLVASLGSGVRSIFRGKRKETASPKPELAVLRTEPSAPDPHDSKLTSLGEVFANKKATSEIYYNRPNYPVGSIIVREKHEERIGVLPQTVIAMVKREAGFSPVTGDWEFFMFDGRTLALQLRETTGNCAACHAQAKNTDWSFRTYMDFPK